MERGEIDRLMIFMPPRHGKSELASRRFPAWYLGRNPKRHVISASYNSELSTDFGREVRNLMASADYADIFPDTRLRPDSKAADRMNTEAGGAYFAAGVGTATTGRGAHLGNIDDPFKDREDADSETQRDKVWNWYRSTFFTRLMPKGAVVLTLTRWHEDDLAGRLLNHEGRVEDGGQWTVIDLPAIDTDNKALWPEWYPLPVLERIRDTIGPREWSALYQQKPQPDEGTFFLKEWFDGRRYQHKPPLHLYGTSDLATKDGSGDYTVHHMWGVDVQGDLYLVDRWREQTTSDVWIERQCDFIALHKPLAWFTEAGPIWRAVEPSLMRRMRERGLACRIEALPSISDKPTSARGFQSRAATKRVWLPDTPDGDAVIDELVRFPTGKYDDEVDACSKIGRALDMAHPALALKPSPKLHTPQDRYHRSNGRQQTTAWG